MYATSQKQLRGAAAALAGLLLLAGCTTGGSDNPSISPSSITQPTSVSSGPAGPAISILSVSGEPVPQLAGHPIANAALRAIGLGLRGGCQMQTMRNDPLLASFRWTCQPGGVTTANFALNHDLRLQLGNLLTGGYAAYLSSTAAAQLEAEGITSPATSNLSAWCLTPVSLQIVFPAGAVAFPLTSLVPYARYPSLFAPKSA